MTKTWDGNAVHSIIDNPHEFSVVKLEYNCDPEDFHGSYLEIHLRRGNELRRLRFLRPRSLKIEEGFPSPTHGMMILDIRDRQWEDTGIEVTDFEASPGRITFFASDVIDLDINT